MALVCISRIRAIWVFIMLLALFNCQGKKLEPVRLHLQGPLRVNPLNPRYFTDNSGRAIFLTGSHTWTNLMDSGCSDPPRRFDYSSYLDFLSKHNHNFFRLWVWEQSRWHSDSELKGIDAAWYAPLPYQRTGPGLALDGKAKFDVTKFNEAYFARLRSRVQQAGQCGIYVSIMLFNGFSIETKNRNSNSTPWRGHPFNASNNINGINGDMDADGEGLEVHSLSNPVITALQEAYVRKLVDTISDLDHILFEISNESRPESRDWQYHMIRYLKQYESIKFNQHLVGMTVAYPGGDNGDLWNSPADWISPNGDLEPRVPADGRKVILHDTDHLCGVCGSVSWVWESFLSGRNPIFMDPYDIVEEYGNSPLVDLRMPKWEQVRRNMGYALTYANRLNLSAMTPHPELASSGCCLANLQPGASAYLTYFPNGNGTVNVPAGSVLQAEWFRPANGRVYTGKTSTQGGGRFSAPFRGEAVLYLHEQDR
jgi:hypothetical protein